MSEQDTAATKAPVAASETGGLLASIEWPWAATAAIAAVLLVISAFVPLWVMDLNAPQYPAGLELTAYGTKMEGDLSEINSLNHYVGVREIHPDSVRELDLFPFAIVFTVLLLGFAAVAPHWKDLPMRWIAVVVVWMFPIGFLVDLQWWLYDYGHDLQDTAAIRIDEFTPKVLGTTHVMNFTTETMVSIGWFLMLAAALIVTFGPKVGRFVAGAWANTEESKPGAKAAMGALLLPAILVGMPGGDTEPPQQAQETMSVDVIHELIGAASPGDTITVPAGTYVGQLNVEKPVVLQGEGMPVIDGDAIGDVVTITAEDVTFRGFVVQNSGLAVSLEPTGILLNGDRATLEGNVVRDVLYGVYLKESQGHTVRNNTISSLVERDAQLRGHGLYLWNTLHNVVEDNVIHGTKDGIFLGFTYYTEVNRNHVWDVRFGVHYMYADDNSLRDNVFTESVAGAAIMYSRRVMLEGNEFADNSEQALGFGILFKDVDDVTVRGNLIHHNRLGLVMEGAPHQPHSFVRIEDNLIAHNQAALELSSTTDAEFTGNSFIGNLQQVIVVGRDVSDKNTWAIDGRGNYWDDYEGYDANGDGVGDFAYSNTGAFDSLVDDNEALKAFQFTLAQETLDMTARWFPIYETIAAHHGPGAADESDDDARLGQLGLRDRANGRAGADLDGCPRRIRLGGPWGAATAGAAMLSVRDVGKKYGDVDALSGVSFDLAQGTVTAVIGANGAGKTTLIKCVTGLVRFEGEVTIDGIDVAKNGKQARSRLGYLPQEQTLHDDLTVAETARFHAELKGVDREKAVEAVEQAGLTDHADKMVGELSGGMRQRLAIAVTLLADPPLVILDEPIAGLDIHARLDLRTLVQQQREAGKSILLSTHWLEDVPYVADNALVLDQGRVVFNGPAEQIYADDAPASRLYLRLNGRGGEAPGLIEQAGVGEFVGHSGDWLIVKCPAPEKSKVLEAISGAGITVLDIRVEEASVGEAISKLREGASE